MLFPGYRNPEYNLLGVSHNTLHAHNEYLEILTDSGLVGMALFVLLAYALVRGMRGTAGWGGFPDPAVGGLAAGIFAMLCEASVSVALRWPPSAYLLALLTGLLAGAVPAAPPRPMRRIVAVPLLAAAAFGLAVGIPHYLRFLRSGYLLFIGKDLTLDTIEQELSLAYGAATAWEQTGDQTRRVEALQRYDHADVLCDSAIELCNRCVTVNPDELGGYYGLGSAWLTRAIIIEPPNPSLSRLLDADGRVRSRDSALAATRMALQAYQALAVRAPDYAELHNNLALTYTRLGQPAMTIRSMRRAYELYAHRRWNYLRQAFELAPLGGAWDALHINMSAIYSELAGGGDRADPKSEGRLTNALWFAGFAMTFEPSAADSLCTALTDLAGQVADPAGSLIRSNLLAQAESAAADSALLADAAAGIPVDAPECGAVLPGRLYAAAVSAAAGGDLEGYSGINRFMMYLYHTGFIWLHEWPRHGGMPPALASAYPAVGPAELWRPAFLESARYLLMMDEYVSGRVRIARTDFAGGVDPVVLEGLEEVWDGVGGPRASLDEGAGGLWLRGSSLAAMAAAADSAALSGAGGVETRLALHYLLVGMTWWTDGSLDEAMRLEVIASIAADRAALDSLLGPGEAPYAVSRLLDGVEPLLDDCIWEEHRAFLAAIRQEIVGGAITGTL
jgi:tetratricopeptide (TPR) repeat protein